MEQASIDKDPQVNLTSVSEQSTDPVEESFQQIAQQSVSTDSGPSSVNPKLNEDQCFWYRQIDETESGDPFLKGRNALRHFIDHSMQISLSNLDDNDHQELRQCLDSGGAFVKHVPLCRDNSGKKFYFQFSFIDGDHFNSYPHSPPQIPRILFYGSKKEFSITVAPVGFLINMHIFPTKWIVLIAEDQWIWLLDDKTAAWGNDFSESSDNGLDYGYEGRLPVPTGFDDHTCIRLRPLAGLDKLEFVDFSRAEIWSSPWRIERPVAKTKEEEASSAKEH